MKKSLKDNREGKKPRRLTLSRETIQILEEKALETAQGATGVEFGPTSWSVNNMC